MTAVKNEIRDSGTTRPQPIHIQISPLPQQTMQAAATPQQTIVPQASPQVPVPVQVQAQGINQAGMAQVMSQVPQTAPSPHGVTASVPHQSTQFYVQTSVAAQMQGPPAIAPAPGPQTATTTVSAIHHLAPQPLAHNQSQMQQFSNQVQLFQGNPYGQIYQSAQGQYLLPIQQTAGMNGPIQQGTLNQMNSPIQVISATGKPFQGQLAPHMLAGNKAGVLQAGQGAYNPGSNQTSGNQTVLISQLGTPLTQVISSQPQNILPAQSSTGKPGDMQKVNNMTFGPMHPSIAWAAATPGTTLQPSIIPNQHIFIRGAQPGQDNLIFQGAQPQAMIPPNSMMASILTGAGQAVKPRSGGETPTTIQPKIANMRPAILPNNMAQLRAGASVSTQTAAGQAIIAPAQVGPPRAQGPNLFSPKGKMRGKTGVNRTSPAIQQQQMQQQMVNQVGIGQVIQTTPAGTLTVNATGTIAAVLPVTPQTIVTTLPKQMAQTTTAIDAMNAVQAKLLPPGVRPSPVAIHPAGAGVRLAKGTPPTTLLATVAAPPNAPIAIVPSSGAVVSVQQQIHPGQHPVPQMAAMQTSMETMTALPDGLPEDPHKIVEAKIETESVIDPMAATAVVPGSNNLQIKTEITPGALVNGTALAIDPPPVSTGPPKAMVKPQVMTHVIEGFVIQEGPEPFPVNRSSLLTDFNKARIPNKTAAVIPQGKPALDNNDGLDKEISKCEACGKIEPRSKLKKNKRFCSNACAKKLSSGVTKRVGPFREVSPSKRLKECDPASEKVAEVAPTIEVPVISDSESKIDILKWTVQDVVDFIENLPGCQDYAEDFQLQEIDGQALMLLKADHLMTAMSIKLGPALKICAQIESMRGEKKEA